MVLVEKQDRNRGSQDILVGSGGKVKSLTYFNETLNESRCHFTTSVLVAI